LTSEVHQYPPATPRLYWRFPSRGVPDWNHQAFADDLSLYVGSTEDANTLLDIVSEFQEWSSLKISIKISLATGALYGRGETQRQKDASEESRK